MTTSADIENVLDAALFFAERGVRVFPVKADKKLPAVTGWQNAATANLDQIVRWWANEYRGCNLGVVADKLIVLDVDTIHHGKGGKDGPATLAQLVAENGPLPATFTVKTASGGYHYYFRDSSASGDTFTKGADKLGPGLDIQTGKAYLVGPFSTIGDNSYEIVDSSDLADLPDWIRERIRDVYIERPAKRPIHVGETVNNKYVNSAITGELGRLDALQSQGWTGAPWDQTTFEVACNLIEISNGDGSDYSLSSAFSDFMAHAPTDDKFASRQHEAKWSSALKKVGGGARVFPAVKPPRANTHIPSDEGVAPVESVGGGLASVLGATPPPPVKPPDPPRPPVDPEDYFGKHGLMAEKLAHDVKHDFALGPDGELWLYSNGIYNPDQLELLTRVTQATGDRYRPAHHAAVSDFVRAMPGLTRITTEQPDPAFIVLDNGVYSWQTNELLEHSPDFGAITKLPIVYDFNAGCPEFHRWINEVVPEDTVELLWQVIGYMLMFGNPFQKAIILQGPGGNGKSTFLRVLQRMIGKQNISALSLRQMSEDRFAVAGMLGKTANLAGDIDSKYLGDASRFKQIVGGDLIEVERKFGQPFSFEPYAVPVFSANEFWKTSDTTHGYWRRWLPIPFPYPVDGRRALDERDLFAETAGIFNRAMTSLRRLMATGDFTLPVSVNELRDKMESAADVIADWFDEDSSIMVNDPQDTGSKITRTECYAAFSDWCRHSGHKGMSSTNFYKRLTQLGYVETKIRGTRHIVGLDIARYDQPALTY